jgi:plasmid maintenance system killer protein
MRLQGLGYELERGCSAGRAQHPSRKVRKRLSRYLTSVRLQATVIQVRIRNFVHKGLKKLYADDATKGVPADTVDKLRKMFAFLDDMDDPEELRALPSWKVHTLTGDRKGHMEPERYGPSAVDLSNRHNRARDLRREFRGLPLGSKEKRPCP